MFGPDERLHEVVVEIAAWTLDQRRQYIAAIEKADGKDEANRLKQSLKDFWSGKGK
jgi:hypothetical protein